MIEINLTKLDRGTHEGMVTVKRGGKVFQRKQKLGRKESESESGPEYGSDYEKNKKEYEKLRSVPTPYDETVTQMIERTNAINAARTKMNESNPKWVAEQKEYAEEQERKKLEPKPKKEYIDIKNIKKGMIIHREDETKLFEVVKVARVNVHVLPYPSLPDIDQPQKVRRYDLDHYIEKK